MFQTLRNKQSEGKIIGITFSTFDILTAGHIYMLETARSMCDYLVVGLLTDPTISRPESKNKPIQGILERFIQLQAVGVVDMIIPFDTEEDILTIIKMIEPDIRIVGEEYKGTKHTGWDLCPIYYNKRNNPYSSSELRKRIYLIEKQNVTAKQK